MGYERLSRAAFVSVESEVKSRGGSTTSRGEQHVEKTGTLPELVDPKAFGVVRRSLVRMEEIEGFFVSTMGLPMLVELRFDTTGSMGNNVEKAFAALPRTYDLIADCPRAVLGRYDVQMMHAIFGDVVDKFVLNRTQAEMGVKIAEQLTMMNPEGGGGDSDEDPEAGLFGGAYLVRSATRLFGLKTYDFTVTDACGRGQVSKETLKRVYGSDVLDKAKENGFGQQGSRQSSWDTEEIVRDLLAVAHGFLLQVRDDSSATDFWRRAYGADRVVILPTIELLPEVEAAIIGLTEGVVSLSDLKEYLMSAANLKERQAASIVRAVSHIPIGEQTKLPNFGKVFGKGAKFVAKYDPFPIGFETGEVEYHNKAAKKSGKSKAGGVKWL